MDDKWAKLEGVVRRVVREEIATALKLKSPSKIKFEEGRFIGLGEIEMQALKAAFPAVDVEKELKEAAAWILLNPTNAPKSNYGAFVQTWMKKHQDRSAIRSIPTRNDPPPKKSCAYCERPATSYPNRTPACDEHFQAAMDHDPVLKRA